MFIKIENGRPVGYPVLEDNLRMVFPWLPDDLTLEILTSIGFARYKRVEKPFTHWNQQAYEVLPAADSNGVFNQTWEIIDLTGAELDNARIEFKKEQKIQFKGKTEWRLDEFARTKDYTTMLHACSYAVSLDPEMQAEGQLCSNLRDATWKKIYQIIAEIDNGVRPIETTFEDIENELPQLSWV